MNDSVTCVSVIIFCAKFGCHTVYSLLMSHTMKLCEIVVEARLIISVDVVAGEVQRRSVGAALCPCPPRCKRYMTKVRKHYSMRKTKMNK